jgi:hypothetical protein
MKKAKSFILSVGLLSIVALVAVGCGTTTPAPKVEAPKIVATYTGDDTCKACHEAKLTAYHTTKHSTALKPLTDFPLNNAPATITVFDGADAANLKGTQLDLSKAKIYGVMMDDYVLAEVPVLKARSIGLPLLRKSVTNMNCQQLKQLMLTKTEILIGKLQMELAA